MGHSVRPMGYPRLRVEIPGTVSPRPRSRLCVKQLVRLPGNTSVFITAIVKDKCNGSRCRGSNTMAALRELVSGQGCSSSSGGSSANPLATLVDTLLLKIQGKIPNQGLTIPSGVPSVTHAVKIRNRAGIVTRHMFPDASPQFIEEQVQAFARVLESSGIEGSSLADELKYQEFLGQQRTLPPRAEGPLAGPSGVAWEDEFRDWRLQDAAAPRGPGWAEEFLIGQPPGPPAPARLLAQAPPEPRFPHMVPPGPARGLLEPVPPAGRYQMDNLWASEFEKGRAEGRGDDWIHLEQRGGFAGSESVGGEWAQEFGHEDPRFALGHLWVQQFSEAHPAESWAEQFEGEEADGGTDLTPEQRKALKGPSPDDPLEDPDAPSWVAQFNEELRRPTANQVPGDMTKLESEMRMTPEVENPYSHHSAPLEEAHRRVSEGRLCDAVQALEAAARMRPEDPGVWRFLGEVRASLDEAGAAVPPLRRAVQLDPRSASSVCLLAQAAIAAGQKGLALGAISRWTDLRNGIVVPPVPLDSAPPADEIEARLQELATSHPGDTSSWTMLGLLRTARGDSSAAAEALMQAVRAGQGRDHLPLLHLGQALLQDKKPDLAERCFEEAGRVPPPAGQVPQLHKVSAWGGLARSLAAQGAPLAPLLLIILVLFFAVLP
eukprot:jgi/Botrbrau1/16267/Bobra.0066s0049.3